MRLFTFWPSIERLFRAGSPFAVFGRIGTIVINAFECQVWTRLNPHICNEIFEGTPSFTYGYSPTAIQIVRNIVFVFASLVHLFPCSVFGHFSACTTMRNASLDKRFYFETPTTGGMSIRSEIGSEYFDKFTASANASKQSIWQTLHNCEPSESLAYPIYEFGHEARIA